MKGLAVSDTMPVMSREATSPITRVLTDRSIDPESRARELFSLVYDELRRIAWQRMASERPGVTLQATALVHEAYLRLMGDAAAPWSDRGQFFAAAAESMRRILVDQARRRNAQKRGGDRHRDDQLSIELATNVEIDDRSIDLEALDAALAALEAEDPRKASVVKLRYFTGLTIDQAARALGISPATADRDWAYAKAFLYAELHRRRDS